MTKVIRAYGQSLGFLRKHGLLWFLWFPFIITVLVIVAGFKLAGLATDALFAALMQWADPHAWMSQDMTFLIDVFYWLLWLALHILLYFMLSFIGGSLILLLMAPVLTWLSEKVAQTLGQAPPAFSLMQLTRDITRAAGLAIRNGLIQLVLSIAALLIGLIPLIGFVSPFLLFAVNAYFFGFGFLDYTLERRRYNIAESSRYAWQHRVQTLGVGTPFALWMLIPFLGPVTAGFIAVFATVAGTIVLENPQAPAKDI